MVHHKGMLFAIRICSNFVHCLPCFSAFATLQLFLRSGVTNTVPGRTTLVAHRAVLTIALTLSQPGWFKRFAEKQLDCTWLCVGTFPVW